MTAFLTTGIGFWPAVVFIECGAVYSLKEISKGCGVQERERCSAVSFSAKQCMQ